MRFSCFLYFLTIFDFFFNLSYFYWIILIFFFLIFSSLFWDFFKVIKFTTKSYQSYYWTPNISKTWPKQHDKLFFPRRAKKALAERRRPPQELELGLRSGPYLLVSGNIWFRVFSDKHTNRHGKCLMYTDPLDIINSKQPNKQTYFVQCWI